MIANWVCQTGDDRSGDEHITYTYIEYLFFVLLSEFSNWSVTVIFVWEKVSIAR